MSVGFSAHLIVLISLLGVNLAHVRGGIVTKQYSTQHSLKNQFLIGLCLLNSVDFSLRSFPMKEFSGTIWQARPT